MRSALSFALLCLLVGTVSCSAVPTSIPFPGITSSAPTPTFATTSVGQLITTVSSISNFSFWIASYSATLSVTAHIASWTGSAPGTALGTSTFVVPASFTYSLVTATMNVVGLDPLAQYIIYFTFPASYSHLYDVWTDAASSGGYVSAVGSTWQLSTSKDVRFSLGSESILTLPSGNFAEGPAGTPWNCIFHTVYSTIQVNWQTGQLNTGYYHGASSSTLRGSCSPAGYYVPYGAAAACQYGEQRYAHLDITGTNYKFNESFTVQGWLPGGTISFSSNNQVLDLMGSGQCGYTVGLSAYIAGGEGTTLVNGGFYIHIIRV